VQTLSLNVDGVSVSYFCVGTVRNQPNETEPSEGRLLIFSGESQVSESPNLRLILIASETVQGCVYSLTSVGGMLAAAINASVCIQRILR
jgi:DNA damage-binding protein 1